MLKLLVVVSHTINLELQSLDLLVEMAFLSKRLVDMGIMISGFGTQQLLQSADLSLKEVDLSDILIRMLGCHGLGTLELFL
jgi:hypothetical protein